MPTLTKTISVVPEGEVYPRTFEVGEKVTGRVAEIAEEVRALEKLSDTKAMKAPENK